MGGISLSRVWKRFGTVDVIRDVSLDIEPGELVVFLGPSGSGKTTLLRMIAGLESIDEGTLTIDGVRSERSAAGQRNVAMVFQNYALYPHMTVAENMAFGLRNIRVAAGGHPPTDRRGGADAGDGGAAAAAAVAAFRRTAPAGGDRAGDRQGAQGVPVRRAAFEPRCGASGADARRTRRTAPAA